MDPTALLLSRIQFGFTISFHIIFPAFTIGLAAWLTVLEALHLRTGRPVYQALFEFWLKIFGVAFGLGVVSGVVMAFQCGTNWSVLSKVSGPIQGPLLSYETFTAFMLEASFFGVLVFGRKRVPPWFYLFSTARVSLGTTLFGVLDHDQQQLDAGAGWLCRATRRLCPQRLDSYHLQFGGLVPFSPYVARGLSYRCVLRCRDRSVVCAV
jgi:Cytochrome bd terminal oxidase subunit I